jgi:hypothetical protein
VFAWLLPMLLSGAMVSWWTGSERGYWLLLIGPAQFLLFYGLFGAAQPSHNRWLNVPARALLGACLFSTIVVGMRFVAHGILKSAGGTRNGSDGSAVTAHLVGDGLGL